MKQATSPRPPIEPINYPAGRVLEIAPTVRDLLAIHAPAAPSWFQPIVPPLPQRPPDLPPGVTDHDLLRMCESWRRDPCFDIDEDDFDDEHDRGQVMQWVDAWEEFRAQTHARNERHAAAVLAQWPWAYADMVLAAREGVELDPGEDHH